MNEEYIKIALDMMRERFKTRKEISQQYHNSHSMNSAIAYKRSAEMLEAAMRGDYETLMSFKEEVQSTAGEES